MSESVDVVVIGAGVMGTSIAYQMARRGLDVVVVDKKPGPGLGSSGSSSAIIRFMYSTLAGTLTAWESAHEWTQFRDYVEAPASEPVARFHRNGMAMIDAPTFPRDLVLGHLTSAGVPFELWDAATLAQRIPGIDTGRHFPPQPVDSEEFFADPVGDVSAVFTPDAGFIDDPRLACANFAQAAVRRGARLALDSTVVSVRQEADQTWSVVRSDGHTWSAPVVVNAGGPWSGAINRMAGVGSDFTVDTRPLRGEVHAIPAPPGLNPPGELGPCLGDPDLGYYLRPEPGGNALIGTMEPACDPLEWIDDPDTANLDRTAAGFERQVFRAARRFPLVTVPNQPVGIAGIYDVTPDWVPIYDRTDRKGFYVAIGTSGNQFKNAPLVGEFMAELVDAVESGTDLDAMPLQHQGRHTGQAIDLGTFSRRRALAPSVGNVIG